MTDNNTSDIHETQQLIVKLAHIAREIESRSMDALNRIEASSGAMQQGAQRLHGGAERFTQQAMQAISHGSQAAVAQGAQQALGQFNHQLQQSTSHALSAADTLREQSRTAGRAQHALVWKALIALAIGSLLAAGGSAEFGTAILRATQSGTLTVCGKEPVLCVKVGEKSRRAGERGEYVLVE
ncbi:hypothetical protein [Variovorax sp. Sphag1AA]|uniref:hypothetical protein n=1 Tax=Variovorax sp. Sphag1AA TaxID=2587027 RepID=UPI0016171F80|nr:hypothetical protein [Variovorax sp. Sphag1AA]MBB3179473.1 putative phage infection (PIP) family protein YhgE [Variovorax sp. Sphag1AA]